ncbi:MAG: hypothetical protein MUF38_19915 [Anaerolineae bacterium]|nr:hypothetical protein [Anaerolineae bacterium]
MSSNQLLDQIRARKQAQAQANAQPAANTIELMEAMIGKSLAPAVRQQVDAMALVPDASGVLRFDDVKLTRVGLVFPVDGMRQDTALLLLDMALNLEGSIQWIVGDLLAYGDSQKWGEFYKAAMEKYQRQYFTVADYKYVCSSVDFSVRTENLTFGHHKLVASLPAYEQREWLDRAVAEGWSVAAMRTAMREKREKLTPTLRDDSKDYDKIRHDEARAAIARLKAVRLGKIAKMSREERMLARNDALVAKAYFEEMAERMA